MSTQDLLQLVIHAVIAIFGVAARELRFKDEKSFQMARLVSNAIVSSFGATIAYFVLSLTSVQPQFGYIMAGFVGWGGPQIIDKLFEKNIGLAKGAKDIALGAATNAQGAPPNDAN